MFNPKTFANSRPDGIGALEITIESGQPRMFVPLKRIELSGEVTGPLASLRLMQIYGYSKEQYDRTLEAVYCFPLPGDAAVLGYKLYRTLAPQANRSSFPFDPSRSFLNKIRIDF